MLFSDGAVATIALLTLKQWWKIKQQTHYFQPILISDS